MQYDPVGLPGGRLSLTNIPAVITFSPKIHKVKKTGSLDHAFSKGAILGPKRRKLVLGGVKNSLFMDKAQHTFRYINRYIQYVCGIKFSWGKPLQKEYLKRLPGRP